MLFQDNTTMSINASYNTGDQKSPIITINVIHIAVKTENTTANATEIPNLDRCSIAMANANKSSNCNYLTLLARGNPRFPNPPPFPPTENAVDVY